MRPPLQSQSSHQLGQLTGSTEFDEQRLGFPVPPSVPLNTHSKAVTSASLSSLHANFSAPTPTSSPFSSSSKSSKLKVSLNEKEGYYSISGNHSDPNSQTYSLSITIAFARNLIRLYQTDHVEHAASIPGRLFYFVYTFMDNQVSTKPFSDIIACQINGERSTIRLHASHANLKLFMQQQQSLEVFFLLLSKLSLSP